MDGCAVLPAFMAPVLRQLSDEQEPSTRLGEVGGITCLRLPLGPVVPNMDEQAPDGLLKLDLHPRLDTVRRCAVQNRVRDDLAYQELDVSQADRRPPVTKLADYVVPTRPYVTRVSLEPQHFVMAAFADLLSRYERHLTSPPVRMQ